MGDKTEFAACDVRLLRELEPLMGADGGADGGPGGASLGGVACLDCGDIKAAEAVCGAGVRRAAGFADALNASGKSFQPSVSVLCLEPL